MRFALALLSLALVLAACDSAPADTSQSQTGSVLELELGETARSDGLTITFESVSEDSRCPVRVLCVWEGAARVALRIDGTLDSLLVTDPEVAPDAFLRRGDVIVRAVDLSPYPGTREPTPGDTPVVALRTEIVDP